MMIKIMIIIFIIISTGLVYYCYYCFHFIVAGFIIFINIFIICIINVITNFFLYALITFSCISNVLDKNKLILHNNKIFLTKTSGKFVIQKLHYKSSSKSHCCKL